MAALALEAGHALERRIAGELNLAFDAATAPRSGGEAVVGQYQFGLMRHVLRDRAQAPIRTEVEIDRVGRGDELAQVGSAVEVAQELALESLNGALVLQAGESGAAAVVCERRHRRGGRDGGGDDRACLEERPAVGRSAVLAHALVLHASGPKNLSTSNLPACRAGAPTALIDRPFLPQ